VPGLKLLPFRSEWDFAWDISIDLDVGSSDEKSRRPRKLAYSALSCCKNWRRGSESNQKPR
jgi:hypothetical protein